MRQLPLVFLILNSYSLFAQNKSDHSIINSKSLYDRIEFKASYTGNILWNQGITIGAEYLWRQKAYEKKKKRGTKLITHQYVLQSEIGFTFMPATQTDTGLLTSLGLIWRRTNPKGKQISIGINPIGLYRSILPEVYEVKGDDVQKKTLAGRIYYAPSLTFGFGKFRKNKALSGRYFNFNFGIRTPYNASILPTFTVSYGYRFKF